MKFAAGRVAVALAAVPDARAQDKPVQLRFSHWVPPFGIDKVTKYHIDSAFYVSEQVWAMNKAKYDLLSRAQTKVMDDHCNNA